MPQIVQWVVDTRKLWTSAQSTADLEHIAVHEFGLLSPTEKSKALSFIFVKDAKLSLASSLLKRLVISKYAKVAWNDAVYSLDSRKKPIFQLPGSGKEPISFNISHQDGVVVLAAVCGYDSGIVEVGVDVVSTIERRARDHISLVEPGGWDDHVNIYAEIFSPGEVHYLKNLKLPSHLKTLEEVLDFKLRYFYSLWCLREAYVKMDGQALTAPWINDLEFHNFHPPAPVYGVHDHQQITLCGAPVIDARVELRSWGEYYMIATSIRTPVTPHDAMDLELRPYEEIDLKLELSKVMV